MGMELPTGVTLAYQDSGPAAGPVVVLLHGFTNDAASWADVIRAIEEQAPDLRIITPDLRGHGASTRPTDPNAVTIEAMAGDVSALLDGLGVQRATLVGHSMGSLVAQALALTEPDRVQSLVIISTTTDAHDTPLLGTWLRDDVFRQWRASLESQGVAWPDEAMARTPRDVDPGIVDWMQQFWNFYPLTPDRPTRVVAETSADLPLATWIGATESMHAFERNLNTLQVPTLALWGTQDAFFPASHQERLVGQLAAAAELGGAFRWKQFGRLPLPDNGLQADDLGHNLTWEIPDVIAEEIVSWLRTGEPTTKAWFTDPGLQIVCEDTGARILGGGTTRSVVSRR